jgi:hypothetical protein
MLQEEADEHGVTMRSDRADDKALLTSMDSSMGMLTNWV